jgi:hypothetical protein
MIDKHNIIMMCDMIYYSFHTRYINTYMSFNGIEHIYIYIVTTRLHRMIDVVFHIRRINMPISLNGTEHMYSITTGLHMMIYKTSYLDVLLCLYFSKV